MEIPKIPLDTASYKLYYVNYEQSTTLPFPTTPNNLFDKLAAVIPCLAAFFATNLGRKKLEASGWLFPAFEACPGECDWCRNPCKKRLYHVGGHWCGTRHMGNPRYCVTEFSHSIFSLFAIIYSPLTRFTSGQPLFGVFGVFPGPVNNECKGGFSCPEERCV